MPPVVATLGGLMQGPERFAPVYRDRRRAPVGPFPYALTFRIVGGGVRVTTCTHYRRHPRRWQDPR